jgi:Zn-dependent M28 family amino/carboxypeptidase
MVVACLVAVVRGKTDARPRVDKRERSCMYEVENQGVSGDFLARNMHRQTSRVAGPTFRDDAMARLGDVRHCLWASANQDRQWININRLWGGKGNTTALAQKMHLDLQAPCQPYTRPDD